MALLFTFVYKHAPSQERPSAQYANQDSILYLELQLVEPVLLELFLRLATLDAVHVRGASIRARGRLRAKVSGGLTFAGKT